MPAALPDPLSRGVIAGSLRGIRRQIRSSRLSTRVLMSGAPNGPVVLFLHGNHSGAVWWAEMLELLPAGHLGVAPDQRGFAAAQRDAVIDASRGLGDLADDAVALLDELGVATAHVVGHSLGGSVLWWLLARHSSRVAGAVAVSPGSPFGFGGTAGPEGVPVWDDHAGSGAGLIHPEFLARIEAGDRSTDSPFSPRSVMRARVYKPPFVPNREDELLDALLSIHRGDRAYPGDVRPSGNWPYFAPGRWGVNNALSPKYALDSAEIVAADPKPPLLWIRGADDSTVSDNAVGDPGVWGPGGAVGGYPGPDSYPPQPMLTQTRHVLEEYAAYGGQYEEVVVPDTGHSPHLESPELFAELLTKHLKGHG